MTAAPASGRPEATGSDLGDVAVLALLAVATTLLTWPVAWAPDQAISIRDDYFLNVWNVWWARQALFGDGGSLYHSPFLYHPVGVSLVRHVLNPVSGIPGAVLSFAMDLDAVYRAIVWAHFWLSGVCFYLFARELSGSRGGALLAALFFAFSPFHLFYLAQMNVLSMEFLPLAGLFLVRSYRGGGWGSALGVAAAAALLAGSSQYYLVYAGLMGALLLAGGRAWAPEVPWRDGALRLARAGALAAVAVFAVLWRTFLVEAAAAGGAADAARAAQHAAERSNDLLGFLWVVPPERVLVAWPALLGYASLALVAFGCGRGRRRLFWLGFTLLFAVLSLGSELHVGGAATGVPLPYRVFEELPVLWMLRKPDRITVMVLLGAGVLLAFGWRDLAARLGTPGLRRAVLAGLVLVTSLERAAVPLATFTLRPSPYLEQLAADDSVHAVADLPDLGGDATAARVNQAQTIHGKRTTGGYLVSFEVGPRQRRESHLWSEAYRELSGGDAGPVIARARDARVDVLLLHKTVPAIRRPDPLDGRTLWAPFVVHGRRLVALRQTGLFHDRYVAPDRLATQRRALVARLGEPAYEDEQLLAFRLGP